MAGRTGWEKRLDVEQGERGAMGLGGSAMPIRLAAACSRSIASLKSQVSFDDLDVDPYKSGLTVHLIRLAN